MFFYLAMDFCMEKISANVNYKSFYIEICSVGQKIHEESCSSKGECKTKKFLVALEEIIENVQGKEANFSERIKFIELAEENISNFLIFEQLLKKFRAEFFHLEEYEFKMIVFSKSEKVNSYLKYLDKIKMFKAKSLTIEKSFL